MRSSGGHLGERATSLVDGELGPEARDAALAHLARCDECRAEVAAQRRLKARLVDLSDPSLPPGLLQRLAELPADGQIAVPVDGHASGHVDGHPVGHQRGLARRLLARRAVPAGPRAGSRPDARPAGRPRPRQRRRTTRLALAGGSLVALGVTAFVAGGQSGGPTVVPNVRQLTVQHAETTGEVPFDLPVPTAPVVLFRQDQP